MPKVKRMLLRDLLRKKGILTPSEFARELGISRQHAWLLWWGKMLPSLQTMKRLEEDVGLDPREMTQLERAEPSRQGRRPRKKPRRKETPPEAPPTPAEGEGSA